MWFYNTHWRASMQTGSRIHFNVLGQNVIKVHHKSKHLVWVHLGFFAIMWCKIPVYKNYIQVLTARCYSSLRRIKSCRRALSRSASVTLINSLIVSMMDYCNSLLAGCSKHLVDKVQRVLNSAARVIFGGERRDHVTPLLCDRLHWPVSYTHLTLPTIYSV